MSFFLLLAVAMLAAACGEARQEPENGATTTAEETTMMEDTGMDSLAGVPQAAGLAVVESPMGVEETVGSIRRTIEESPAQVVTVVNHAAAAEEAGLRLRPTTLLIFGNPKAGTPLMQAEQSAGIDLPQKFLAWEDEGGRTWLAYNTAEYLAERHGIEDSEALEKVEQTLRMLAEGVTGGEVVEPSTSAVEGNVPTGVVTTKSENGFQLTVQKLEGAIEEQGLNLVTTVDHQQNAESVDMDLRPTTLLVFGNPEAGTPLMQGSQTVGIDLPQKILVREGESGQVNVSYNDPKYLAERHGLQGVNQQLEMISGAISMLAEGATSPG